jgi:anti-anti-sigma factor
MDLRSTKSGVYDTAMPRIELNGEYDLSTKEDVASLFRSLRADGPVVIDMTKVTYVDSSFLHELAGLHSRFTPHSVTLLGVSGHLQRVFDILNFDRLFEIVEAK